MRAKSAISAIERATLMRFECWGSLAGAGGLAEAEFRGSARTGRSMAGP